MKNERIKTHFIVYQHFYMKLHVCERDGGEHVRELHERYDAASNN